VKWLWLLHSSFDHQKKNNHKVSKELEQKLDVALEAIDQLKAENAEMKETLAKYGENVTSLKVASAPQTKRVLNDPGVVEVKDAEGKKVKVRFASLAFRVPAAGGSIVKYLAEEVAKNAALMQELYEQHPTVFAVAK
jgi:hypothetical protein